MFRNLVRRSLLFVGIAALITGCSAPEFVDRVTLVNDTEYPAHVEVSDGDRKGWLSLTDSQPGSTRSVREVIDQGETWVFRFSYAGKHEEEVSIPRRDLEQAAWRVEIPDGFAATLRSMGVQPPQ